MSQLPPGVSRPGPQRAFYELAYVPALYLFLAFLPLSIGISILRYRLYDIDLIINRALVYVPLTAILAGLYSAAITFFQKLFVAVTGEGSDAAIVLTTLAVASSFTPVKNWLQAVVDKRFKEAPDPTRRLSAFAEQVKASYSVLDPTKVTLRLLDEAAEAFEAGTGVLYLQRHGRMERAHTYGDWQDGDAEISAPIEYNGTHAGLIRLGTRKHGHEYTDRDRQALQKAADVVAEAIGTTTTE